MSGRSLLLALTIGALLLTSGTLPQAQTRNTPADNAANLIKVGQYDEADKLLQNERDPRSIALRARALIARGRYQDAEKALTPAVTSAPTSDAALELGLLQIYLGRKADGTRTLQRIVNGPQGRTAMDVLRQAQAARALGQFQDSNTLFRDADRLAPKDPEINTAWGMLFLEKAENESAQKSFEIALEADANNAEALTGMARLVSDLDQPAALKALDRALKINPNYVPAYQLSAEIALDNRERQDAHASIDKALGVNPNSLEVITLDAALAFLEDRQPDFTKRVDAALKINPVYAEVYRVAGDVATRNYRFAEAIPLTKKALELDPNSSRAHADLGVELLRVGDEAGARPELETAYKLDPFYSSVVTKNLLAMLDKVDTFVTVQDGNITMRFDPAEAGVMREQAVPLAREALDTLSKRWNFTPEGPILIEMFPVHDDFAVRTLGLPGMIGALGVCFGKVVALDSPHARPPGEYNWQPTLWHELTHVITLQMSKNRIPRWLSEGISQWEEKRGRPEWGWEMDVSFASALSKGQTIKLDALNEAFSDPKLISLAYYEASLVAEHFAQAYGEPALQALVKSYAKGITDEQAFQEVFGANIDQVQASFDAAMQKKYEPILRALKRPEGEAPPELDELKKVAAGNPDSFAVQMALAKSLEKSGDHAGAITALERASALIPKATGDDNPNKLIAAIAEKQGDTARAIRALQDVMKVDHADVESARRLVALTKGGSDAQSLEDAYQRLVNVDPFDAAAEAGLGHSLMQKRDSAGAVRAFRSALAANPPDKAAAHTDLAEGLLAVGNRTEAKQEALAALEIAPSFERAQDLLLKLVDTGEK
ncbi:MAG TPA: tetratricopeptide repeat protein [Vicinamibacterales bacterium]|nr:tetratricopeptide repeat protein [Vicinamibacterales bacterium]